MNYIVIVACIFATMLSGVFSEKLSGDTRLTPQTFQPLPLGAIVANGWLRNQLLVQANGFSGSADEVWPDIANSQWIGGWAEGWERFPYYLDGFVPLAVHTQDPKLLLKMHKHIDYILSRQTEDGWIGPTDPNGNLGKDKRKAFDPWPVFVFLKAIIQYAEAFPNDDRIIPAVTRFLKRLDSQMDVKPLDKYEWAQFRWQDLAVVIHWLYDRTQQDWLIDLSQKAAQQGYDWVQHFEEFKFKEKSDPTKCSLDCHGVNNAQGIKQGAVQFRENPTDRFKRSVQTALDNLDRYHGTPTGIFSADELLAGLNPAQGTELCAVVEYMFSLEVAISNIGNISFADRLERIAYNALPSTFDPAMQYHQYVQQPNQVVATMGQKQWWTNDDKQSNLYGIAPNYGCCTANYHQGWPKFTSSLWMKSVRDEGLVAIAYAPNTVTTTIKGSTVKVVLETDYPFGDGSLNFTVTSSKSVDFPIAFRIPSWAHGATIEVGSTITEVKAGAFFPLTLSWNGVTNISLVLPLTTRVQSEYGGALSIHRGPILLGLQRNPESKRVDNCKPTECDNPVDFELRSTTDWNFALLINQTNPDLSIQYELSPISVIPFNPVKVPIKATIQARKVSSWTLNEEYQAAITVPNSPVTSQEPLVNITLVPFGSTNLRVSVFPYLLN